MRIHRTRLHDTLTALKIVLLKSTDKKTDIVACTTFVKKLTEHLDVSNSGLLSVADPHDLNFLHFLDDPTLNAASGHGSTTFDREHVLNRHEEILINRTLGLGNIAVDSLHKLKDSLFLGSITFESFESGTLDNGNIIPREFILTEELAHLHLDELEKLRDHVEQKRDEAAGAPSIKHFEVIEELGNGNYSSIYRAKRKADGQTFALKLVEKAQVDKIKKRHPNVHNEIKMEKRALAKLQDGPRGEHPNLIKMFRTFQDYYTLYYMMELCEGGELFERIVAKPTHHLSLIHI
mgnify:CR=1 FL=1